MPGSSNVEKRDKGRSSPRPDRWRACTLSAHPGGWGLQTKESRTRRGRGEGRGGGGRVERDSSLANVRPLCLQHQSSSRENRIQCVFERGLLSLAESHSKGSVG